MVRRQGRRMMALVGMAALLAACNLARNPAQPPSPTVGTPVAWAMAQATATEPSADSTSTPTGAPTDAPTDTPPDTAAPLPTKPPLAAATLTATFLVPLDAWLPTATPRGPQPETPALAPTQEVMAAPPSVPPTNTPRPVPTATGTPVPPGAHVCPTCDYLRLRESPGDGAVITNLAANAPLTVIGRSEDGTWVQVITDDGVMGWVAAEYLVLSASLDGVTVSAASVPTRVAVAADVPESPYTTNVISGVSSHARRIFQYGRSLGNSAYTFTRVGDSITAAPQFLTQIGAGNYRLGEYDYLAGAIRFFSGPNARGQNPFAATSIAARNGWGTTSILDPNNADPGLCHPGETPLACEYRVVKPAVALIMVGTNDSGGLPTAEFRANLERIVRISIDMGVIPVLSTIPPKRFNAATDGRVPEFNQVIIATARAYDVPLWDYGLAMRATPGDGLDADGVHPSTPPDGMTTFFDEQHLRYGYTVRNLTALHVLWTLWQQVLYDGNDAPILTSLDGEPGADAGVPVLEGGAAPGAAACPGTAQVALAVGGTGRVTPGLPNKLRSAPSTSAAQVGSIPGGAAFTVLGGPQCADGLLWYQVEYQGVTGWTASGTPDDPWIAAN